MNNLVADYYRFPEGAIEFSINGRLSRDLGYFTFGSGTICFGQSTAGFRSRSPQGELYDAWQDVDREGPVATLPFDPDEIIDNLRYERYCTGSLSPPGIFSSLLRNSYYLLRPAIHISIRRRLQKLHLNGWDELHFPGWPVDRTVDRLMEKLLLAGLKAKELDEVPFIWFWPDGADGCSIMTHDIETKLGQSFCREVMDMDASFDIPASFQVVPEKRYPVGPDFLMSIRDRGFELNIQDLNHDGHLFRDQREFLRRAEKINSYAAIYGARGFRSAILYRNQEWYDALKFDYDMTVPNVAHLDPQRGGCCTIMPYFIGNMVELPVTTIQDYSLFHILNDYSLGPWKRQIELILQGHGLITFIVHPDYIKDQRARDIYKGLLKLLSNLRNERNVWLALPREVSDWWRKRHRMWIRRSHGGWQIEGPGSDRARLAFARIKADRIEYSVV